MDLEKYIIFFIAMKEIKIKKDNHKKDKTK